MNGRLVPGFSRAPTQLPGSMPAFGPHQYDRRRAPALDRASGSERVRDAAARRGAPARQGDRPRADRALHGARPAADDDRARCGPRPRRAPRETRAAAVRPRRMGLPAAHAHGRPARSDPAPGDGDPRRARARAAPRPRAPPGAGRRHRVGCDRARDRRRASRSGRHRPSTSRPTRSSSRRRTPPAPASRSRSSATTSSRPSTRARGISSSRTRRTSTPADLPSLQPEVRDWEPHEALIAEGAVEAVLRGAASVLAPGGGARTRGRRRTGRRDRDPVARPRVRRGDDHEGSRRDRAGGRRRPFVSDADAVVRAVADGRLAILPTDTVYGLACTAFQQQPAVDLYRLKGRSEIQPTALVAASIEVLLECLPELRGGAESQLRALLPGPFTLVVANPARRFAWLSQGRPDTIGVRVPALVGAAADVLERLRAIVATSANLPGGQDPRRLEEVPGRDPRRRGRHPRRRGAARHAVDRDRPHRPRPDRPPRRRRRSGSRTPPRRGTHTILTARRRRAYARGLGSDGWDVSAVPLCS